VLTIFLGQLDGMLRLLQVGTSDHQFGAADVDGPLDDFLLVVIVSSFAVVDSAEYGVA
jgi:hypothetical protein